MLKNVSIGLFIDGSYYKKECENAEKNNLTLNISNLIRFCVKYLSAYFDFDTRDCQITEKHFYRGRKRANKIKYNQRLLIEEREFEDELINEDVMFHYKHVDIVKDDLGKETNREKGIDVWFALEAYEIAIARDLDIVVIFTGDGDHEMLLNKIKALKKKAVLLTGGFGEEKNVSRLLREEATLHIELKTLLAEHKEYLPVFEKKR